VAKIRSFENELRKYLATTEKPLMDEIQSNPVMTPELETRIRNVIRTFKETIPY
jgi:F0F1-type ATP synthase alpha subunit